MSKQVVSRVDYGIKDQRSVYPNLKCSLLNYAWRAALGMMRIPSFRFFHSIKYFPQNIFNFLSLTCSLLTTQLLSCFEITWKRHETRERALIFIRLEIWLLNETLYLTHVWSSEPQKNTGMLRRIFYWAKLSSWSQTNLSYELFCRVFMFIFRGKTAAETRRGRGEGDLSLEFVFCWRSGDCCQHQASLVRPALINTTIVSLPQ